MTGLIQNDYGLIFCTASGEAKCWLKENKQNIDIPAEMIQVEAGDWVQVQLSKSRKVLRVCHLDTLNIPLQTRVQTNKTGVRHVEVRVLLKVVDQVTLHSPCIGYVDCAAGQLNLKLNEKLFAWCQKFQDPGTYHAWTISPEPNIEFETKTMSQNSSITAAQQTHYEQVNLSSNRIAQKILQPAVKVDAIRSLESNREKRHVGVVVSENARCLYIYCSDFTRREQAIKHFQDTCCHVFTIGDWLSFSVRKESEFEVIVKDCISLDAIYAVRSLGRTVQMVVPVTIPADYNRTERHVDAEFVTNIFDIHNLIKKEHTGRTVNAIIRRGRFHESVNSHWCIDEIKDILE